MKISGLASSIEVQRVNVWGYKEGNLASRNIAQEIDEWGYQVKRYSLK